MNKIYQFDYEFVPGQDQSVNLINRSSRPLWILSRYGVPNKVQPNQRLLAISGKGSSRNGSDCVVNLRFTLVEGIDFDPEPGLQHNLLDLLNQKKFSDFKLTVGDFEFPCHKAVLANRSDVFARLLRSEGGVGNNVLQLDSHKPAVIKQMIEFVYTYQLPEGTKSSPELLAIADQFNLKELALLCELELSKMVTCQNAIKILNIADKVAEAKRLKGFIIEFMSQNIFSFIGTADWKEIIEPNPELLNAIKSASVKLLIHGKFVALP